MSTVGRAAHIGTKDDPMSSYRATRDFYSDTARLIGEGATLRSLYDRLIEVTQGDPEPFDASPARMRTMAEHWSQAPDLVPIRLSELFAGTLVEHTDDYVLAMVGALGGRHEQDIRLFMLRHDHALRDEVFWRIFEVEGGGEISLANVDKISPDVLGWHNTVVLLVNEGTLDRGRVLRSCLEALNRDFSSYRVGWFSRVYAALAPTPEEAARDQDLLRLCLGSSVTATLSLSVKTLDMVNKAGLLDAPAFVDVCGSAFAGPKATAITLVRTLDAIAAAAVVSVETVAPKIALGLAHSHADVQRAVIKVLNRLEHPALIDAYRDSLAPAVMAELQASSPSSAKGREDNAAPERVAGDSVSGPPVPELLVPWTDGDAFDRYAALLEQPEDAMEFELALAWLAMAENVAKILAPLAKRASSVYARDDGHYPAALLLVAVAPETEFLPQRFSQFGDERQPRPPEEEHSALPSFVTRLREVAAMLQGSTPRRPLLATPTDSLGWVELDILLDRLQSIGKGTDLLPADRSGALWRVHPDQRAQALETMGGELPMMTEQLRIEWIAHGSDTLNASGQPQWVYWSPEIRTDWIAEPSCVNPALIRCDQPDEVGKGRGGNELLIAELGLATPASTLTLIPLGIDLLNAALIYASEHRAPAVLRALAKHPGQWTAETVQLLGLGLGAQQTELRAQASELFAAAIPSRIDVATAAEGLAACACAVVLKRWAASFTDAATLAPAAVIGVLVHMLPSFDHKTPNLASLLNVLLNESLRHSHPLTDAALRSWLGGFSGTSSTAKMAKALLA